METQIRNAGLDPEAEVARQKLVEAQAIFDGLSQKARRELVAVADFTYYRPTSGKTMLITKKGSNIDK
jgi:hypothetical protein